MFPSDLQKLLEMVREDARRTVMMENGLQRKAPRYVSCLLGQRQPGSYNTYNTGGSSCRFSTSSQRQAWCLQPPSQVRTPTFILQIRKPELGEAK